VRGVRGDSFSVDARTTVTVTAMYGVSGLIGELHHCTPSPLPQTTDPQAKSVFTSSR
jgi:hypothetical protein